MNKLKTVVHLVCPTAALSIPSISYFQFVLLLFFHILVARSILAMSSRVLTCRGGGRRSEVIGGDKRVGVGGAGGGDDGKSWLSIDMWTGHVTWPGGLNKMHHFVYNPTFKVPYY